jgi:hypothetical protein
MAFLHRLWHLLRSSTPLLTPAAAPPPVAPAPLDLDQFFRQQLQVELQTQFPTLSLTASATQLVLASRGLTISCKVLAQTRHPTAFTCTLAVRVVHATYFPQGLDEYLAGIGHDEVEALTKGAHSYVEGVFTTIQDSLAGQHDPALDLLSATGQPLWHPLLGPLQVQGAWSDQAQELPAEGWWELLKPALLPHLLPQPFHWLKVYASRQPNGEFVGECNLNNKPWEEGLTLVQEQAIAWPYSGRFAGQKQFILLRQCPPMSAATPL